jgi:hypothetical protein
MAWLIIASIGTVGLVATWIIYGRLIVLQTKIWTLAKRGFHLVEHIGTNRVRTYFYLRPKDNKFDFKSGFYVHYPETATKTGNLMPKPPLPPKGPLWKFKKPEELDKLDQMDAEEAAKLEKQINKLVYDSNAVTLRWGIPIITYVGNSPYPVNFEEPDKEYGAQVIKDVYIRLLATEQYGFMRKMIIIGVLVMGVTALALLLLYFAYRTNGSNMAMCIQNWNSTITSLTTCTAKLAVKEATSVVLI